MRGPLVSIIVPAYNAAAFLTQSIGSARQQTHSNLEIIIVDDASTDNTFELAGAAASHDSRIRVLRHEKNRGLAATRNTAIAAARGEWLAFLDAPDDVFMPEKIERQLQLAGADARANLLYTNYVTWDGEQDLDVRYKKRSRFPDGDVSKKLIFGNQFCPSTVMLRRETVGQAGGFNEELLAVEDWDLWLRIAERSLWARGVWEPQLRYRVWTGNMSKNGERMTRYAIATLESALARSQPAERRALYRRGLDWARANREFALARQFVGKDGRSLAAAIWRAWRLRPTQIKWLLWMVAACWPVSLGGKVLAGPVHRRILARW